MCERSVHTAQGEVSYETVICSSCGDEVAKEGATRLIIGEIVDEDRWVHRGAIEYEFELHNHDKGWLCDFCHENPAAYPHRNDKTETSSTESHGRLWHLTKFIKG